MAGSRVLERAGCGTTRLVRPRGNPGALPAHPTSTELVNARINRFEKRPPGSKKTLQCGFLKTPNFCKIHAGARLFLDEKVAMSRPSARLGASTEITKKNQHPTPCYGNFHAVRSFFGAENDQKPLKKLVLRKYTPDAES